MSGMKIFLLSGLLIISSCGSLRFDINGVDHDKVVDNGIGCMSDTECDKGRTCAPVKGDYPGLCADHPKAVSVGEVASGVGRVVGVIFRVFAVLATSYQPSGSRIPSSSFSSTGCSSDYQCGYGYACVSTSGYGRGQCAQVVDRYGLPDSSYKQEHKIHKTEECPAWGCN